MITNSCIEEVLKKFGFTKKGKKLLINFDGEGQISVDLKKEEINYPENTVSKNDIENGVKPNGIIVNDHTTCNFSHDENFVVLLCICQLLKQGYHICDMELEPKWPLGRNSKSGKADILVKDNNNNALIIIECKTSQDGKKNEFEKEWTNMLRSGDNQLFSYFQQRPDTKYLCLYTVDYINERILPEYYLINVQDNSEYLDQCRAGGTKEVKGFKDADTAKQKWDVWKSTYSGDFATKGLFEDTTAYLIGKSKYNFKDLEPLTSADIGKKYHKYASILRLHTVSNRENAFNKLCNLFLCKVVDEIQLSKGIKDELGFYWKGKQYDNPFDMLDRLQKLYAEGMKEFLKDDVSYVEQKEIDDAFNLRLKGKTKERIDGLFRKLKYFSNSDFSFIDVYNEDLFYKNFNILLQVIIMLQDIHITRSEDNQFLGDFYELFLGAGVHQSEGQYFTPTPITNFIVRSLPEKDGMRVLDFACGAGHFLTEYAKYNDGKQFTLTGIDKDNRLSKLTKIASFMYGQDIKVIYADALSNLEKYGIIEHSYDCIIANPPFSVKGFLDVLLPEERRNYKLINCIEEKAFLTNDSIECFFVERAAQLLDKDGILSIVLPYGILHNSGVYSKMRKLLLREFEIISIVSMNKITFGTTGTQAIILFAKRRDFKNKDSTNFCMTDYYDDLVNQYCNKEELSRIDAEFENSEKLRTDFCEYMGYDRDDFENLYKNRLSKDAEIMSLECFEEYFDDYNNECEKELAQYLEKIDKERRGWERRSKKYKEENPWVEPEGFKPALTFEEYVMPYELEKFRYWLYTHETQVLIVKSPEGKINGKSNKKEVTSFLGYEWKQRKGSEGIHYLSKMADNSDEELDELEQAAMININSINYIQTPLYNPQNPNDNNKINYYIKRRFAGESVDIPPMFLDDSGNQTNISLVPLIEMLDFDKKEFDAAITVGSKNKMVHFDSIYDVKSINKICVKIFAGGDKPQEFSDDKTEEYNVAVVGNGSANKGILGYTKHAKISEKCVTVAARGTVGYTILRDEPIMPIVRLIVLVANENECRTEYLDYFLKAFNIGNTGSVIPQLTVPYIKKVKIPVPPKKIQNKTIKECDMVKADFENNLISEQEFFDKIKDVFLKKKIVLNK